MLFSFGECSTDLVFFNRTFDQVSMGDIEGYDFNGGHYNQGTSSVILVLQSILATLVVFLFQESTQGRIVTVNLKKNEKDIYARRIKVLISSYEQTIQVHFSWMLDRWSHGGITIPQCAFLAPNNTLLSFQDSDIYSSPSFGCCCCC